MTNAELDQQVRELRAQVEQLAAGGAQVKTFTVTDPLTGQQITGPAVLLSVDPDAGVGYVAPLVAFGVPVPLDQLK